jgi:hypothetical protein
VSPLFNFLAEVIGELGAHHTGLRTKRGRRQLLFELTRRRLKSNLLTENLLQTKIFKESKYEDHLGNNFNNHFKHFIKSILKSFSKKLKIYF